MGRCALHLVPLPENALCPTFRWTLLPGVYLSCISVCLQVSLRVSQPRPKQAGQQPKGVGLGYKTSLTAILLTTSRPYWVGAFFRIQHRAVPIFLSVLICGLELFSVIQINFHFAGCGATAQE
jgi:hypothetical protein